MPKIFIAILLLALAAYGQQKRLAIINTVDDEEPSLKISELNHLTDRLREIANQTLRGKNFAVMTQESIVAFLGSQEEAAKKCKESSCLAQLGREVNADYVGQGRIGRFGSDYTIKVELYESGKGILVSSFTGNSNDIYGLLEILNEKAPTLFEDIAPPANSKTSQLTTKKIEVDSRNSQVHKKSFNEKYEQGRINELDRIRLGIGLGIDVYFSSDAIFKNIKSPEWDYTGGGFLGFRMGPLLNIPIYTTTNRQLSFSPELYYVYRNFNAYDSLETEVISINEHIIIVPLLVKYWLFNWFFGSMPFESYMGNSYIEGGVQLGLPLKTTIENSESGSPENYVNRNKFDFEIVIGAGIYIYREVFVGIRLGYHLGDFDKTFDSSLGVFTGVIMGYYF
ncbi:MAG: PorT family protein [Fibromonadales bacterium]|nr:PorT family protein [Fibromonadales bacterium]